MSSIAEKIRNASGRPIKIVPIPQWDVEIPLRALNGPERGRYDDWRSSIIKRPDFSPVWAAGVVIMHICDETGERAFPFDKLADLTAMADDWAENRSSGVIEKLFWECDALSLFTKRSLEKKSDNSSGDRSGDSGTSSPESTAG